MWGFFSKWLLFDGLCRLWSGAHGVAIISTIFFFFPYNANVFFKMAAI